jgi:hypothetical protein
MAKKKTIREEANTMMWTLNYVYNTISCYGNDNDYSHDLMLSHLEDVIQIMMKDKEVKQSSESAETTETVEN